MTTTSMTTTTGTTTTTTTTTISTTMTTNIATKTHHHGQHHLIVIFSGEVGSVRSLSGLSPSPALEGNLWGLVEWGLYRPDVPVTQQKSTQALTLTRM